MEVEQPTNGPRDWIQQLIAAEDLVLVQEPTIVDVCSFQEALANALAQCTPYMFFEEHINHSFSY